MKKYHLFDVYGIELEYMIVDKDSLNILPISDLALTDAAGHLVSDFEDGPITWSNELVMHVIELKTSGPVPTLNGLGEKFQTSLLHLQQILEKRNAALLPSAMHPWMNPNLEARLWPHDNNEIYDAYNRIFSCQGHGWSNLQSMHINLPFADDQEFAKLHTAIRFLLPLLPALSASSPIVENKLTGIMNNRLAYYEKNQKAVPRIAGQVIPEPVLSEEEYQSEILEKIYQDITPHDPDEILREEWLNSRGAIARFDRNAIEIRVLDLQECPRMDLAIADFIVSILKCLVSETFLSFKAQLAFSTESLKQIFDATVKDADQALINNTEYLQAWGLESKPAEAREIFTHLLAKITAANQSPCDSEALNYIFKNGTLARRLEKSLTANTVFAVYQKLSRCLFNNTPFEC